MGTKEFQDREGFLMPLPAFDALDGGHSCIFVVVPSFGEYVVVRCFVLEEEYKKLEKSFNGSDRPIPVKCRCGVYFNDFTGIESFIGYSVVAIS